MDDLFSQGPAEDAAAALAQGSVLRVTNEAMRLVQVFQAAVEEAGAELESDDEYQAALLSAMHRLLAVYAVSFKDPKKRMSDCVIFHLETLKEAMWAVHKADMEGRPHG